MVEHVVTVVAAEPEVVVVAPDPLVVAVALELSLPLEQPAASSPSPPRRASAPRRETGLARRSVGFLFASVMPTGCPSDLQPI
jgi:hypothetical protein